MDELAVGLGRGELGNEPSEFTVHVLALVESPADEKGQFSG